MDTVFISILVGLFAVLFAGYTATRVLSYDSGTKEMMEISNAIKEGAMAYLHRQYKTIAVVAIILTALLWYFLSLTTAISFLLGAVFSALAGYIGMNITVRANVRTAQAAKNGLNNALNVAFKGGSVTGLFVVGLGLIGVSGLYLIYNDPRMIIGFGFGASLISLFARVGGGIYTKAADVGADLVGKVEKNIPEDDPRNPAVIADNVGDNVGDCAGMGADLFETYVVTTLSAMLLGFFLFANNANAILYPLALGAIAIIASIIGTFFVKTKENGDIMMALYRALAVSGIISAIGFYFATKYLGFGINLFYASLIGLFITILVNVITEYFTSTKYSPVKKIAEASQTGAGTNVITGLAVGLKSTVPPVLVICTGILLAYHFAGLYGIAVAAMAMLSLTGIIVAIDSYGPITDNAGGIAEMVSLPSSIRKITDKLDAVGNTTKAVTKGYAISSAALAALALFAAYGQEIELAKKAAGITSALLLDISSPYVLIGLFIGAMLPFLFSALCMQAVGVAAKEIVVEVRKQFADGKIMKRLKKPNYASCVDIVTKAAQKEMMLPALLAVLSPLVVGFLLGAEALGGLLMGVIISGLLLAIQMTTGGAAWDNAKKYVEAGNLGGKGSDTHKAAVVGDTVGDPFKDTAGPALNTLIKVINTISLLFAALFI